MLAFADKINDQVSGESIRLTKNLFHKIQNLNIEDAFSLAAEYNAHARSTEDCKKGIAAFINKEKITW